MFPRDSPPGLLVGSDSLLGFLGNQSPISSTIMICITLVEVGTFCLNFLFLYCKNMRCEVNYFTAIPSYLTFPSLVWYFHDKGREGKEKKGWEAFLQCYCWEMSFHLISKTNILIMKLVATQVPVCSETLGKKRALPTLPGSTLYNIWGERYRLDDYQNCGENLKWFEID